MAERELAVVPDQDVHAEQGDGVDEHLRALEQPEVAQDERQHARRRQQERQETQPQWPRHHHTRWTAVRPNRPLGRTSSTMRITASATVSFSSVPMKWT